ncbi:2-oxoglutarate-dependent dioxygenase 21, chloroplastic [Rhodamnia argentea]|uniref:2-oxoglutarate-dependent dioxygenase 21, chloroplastic n=1 Tax=Rhodamnia argentea TaxID=178133 RepID=A0ABM3GTT6_9MYRT|nr:2-oxoglutarate-dependent dioxygenase 21, chloroplastic [Rhodamnia argentea]
MPARPTESKDTWKTSESAQEQGLEYVRDAYQVPLSDRPSLFPDTADVPLIDLGGLWKDPARRPAVFKDIGNACRCSGFFQIVNHGICQTVMDEALHAASSFLGLPAEEKMKYMSSNVHEPVRYATSLKDGIDKIQFWRVFLEHYAHPLEHWMGHWPENPPHYRYRLFHLPEKMGKFCAEARNLTVKLMEAITEGLGLGPSYLTSKMEEGMQVMAVNCCPPCPDPEVALGLPPHSDYTCLTVVLQGSPGLQIMDLEDCTWKSIPKTPGALQVHVGDHMEVLSDGLYKSVVHRAVLNSEQTRISIASLHSLGMNETVEPAEELVGVHGKKYRGSSFRDLLNFLASNDLGEGKSFISTLMINQ